MLREDKMYSYEAIENFAKAAGFYIKQLGSFSIGKQFIVLSDQKDSVFSFVMTTDNYYEICFQYCVERDQFITDGHHYICVPSTELMGITDFEIDEDRTLDERVVVKVSELDLEKIAKKIFS